MDKSLLMHKTVIMNKMSKENNRRRILLKAGIVVATVGGINLLSSCKSKEKSEGEGQEVSPPEDLMQEHGLLNRILLIYDQLLHLFV